MAIPSSGTDRRTLRRRQTRDEALDHALDVIAEGGVGGLSVSEVARRTGMRGPSLYKYFPSLHALYDALFARGLRDLAEALQVATAESEPGLDRLRSGGRAVVRWCVENPALAQLLFWRPVPGFEPSAETFAASQEDMTDLRDQLRVAVAAGQLAPAADSDEAVRLLTVLYSGLLTQQLANQPGASFESGLFSRLTDEALDMFFTHYAP
jgi:AcrR family transcriptional regulator